MKSNKNLNPLKQVINEEELQNINGGSVNPVVDLVLKIVQTGINGVLQGTSNPYGGSVTPAKAFSYVTPPSTSSGTGYGCTNH